MSRAASAGLLLFRTTDRGVDVLLAHPGGPFWAKRDEGAWTVPKGIVEAGEDPAVTAAREFREETGFGVPETGWISLGTVVQRSGKTVHAWAVRGDADPTKMSSNTFTMEWPPQSGTASEFPEVDRVEWFTVEAARPKLNPAQVEFLDRLLAKI